MAAFNKLGSLLRHSALPSGAPASSAPALFNAARLMSTKLFVGGEILFFFLHSLIYVYKQAVTFVLRLLGVIV
jgi:hypothetical protein